jgi:hypothetical protein
MSKSSFKELISSLKCKNFKITSFNFTEYGKYSIEDADWNYKDVTHTEKIHENVNQIQGAILNDITTSVNLQKIAFFGITFPLVLVNYEYKKNDQVYFTSLGPFIIIGNVINTSILNIETKVTTNFVVGSKGIFSIFHPLVKYFISKNHAKLMSEDIPMRERRGVLRENGHSFYSPAETYSFSFTEEITRSNVYMDQDIEAKIKIFKSEILCAKENSILGKKIGILSFFITIDGDQNIKLWPTTCPHEGAPLTKNCIKKNSIECPWHARKLQPLLIINKDKETKILPNIDFAIKESSEFFEIRFRNKPKYYDNKPYKHFSFED